MQKLLSLEDGRELTVNICDVCGHAWIQQGDKQSQKCPHRGCNAWTWNRAGVNSRLTPHRAGRPGKLEQTSRGLRPISDIATGRHHTLCPCLVCLVQLSEDIRARHDKLFMEWLAKVSTQGRQTSKQTRLSNPQDRLLGSKQSHSFPLSPTLRHEQHTKRCPP